jgi:hypothetical protein
MRRDLTYLSIPWDSLPQWLQRILSTFGIGPGVRVSFTKRVPVDDETLRRRFEMLLIEHDGKRTAAFAALAEETGYCERHLRRRINGNHTS